MVQCCIITYSIVFLTSLALTFHLKGFVYNIWRLVDAHGHCWVCLKDFTLAFYLKSDLDMP